MIGTRIGIKSGIRAGLAAGISSDEVSLGGVQQDGPGPIYVPTSAADFTALAITTPNSLWSCQEASGNLADSIGSLTLTAAGTPSYRQAMPAGWGRYGVGGASAAGRRFVAAAASGPDPSTTSSLWLFYVQATVVAAGARSFMMVSDAAAACESRTDSTGHHRAHCNAVNIDGTSLFGIAAVRPHVIRYDRTNSVMAVYTDQEKVTGTYSAAVTDGNKGIGASTIASQAALYTWGCMWSGAEAEISDAALKTRLQTLGWTVTGW